MADTPHPTYTVGKQHKTTVPDGSGGYVEAMHVPYRTASGVDSHVVVPMTHYTPQHVHSRIVDEASRIAQVEALGNTQPGNAVPLA